MNDRRIFFYLTLLAIVLLSAYALFDFQKQATKKSHATASKAFVEKNSNVVTSPAFGNSTTQISLGKIISDNTTSSNRIVVAEKDGVRKTAHIPQTLAGALTDEQILQSLFSSQTNAPAPKKKGRFLNKHLVFYGLTMDDKTNIVAGAKVTGSVMVWDNQSASRQVPVETISGSDGRFQFDMDDGQWIGINASKGTNYISPPSQSFRYGAGSYGPTDSLLISNPSINEPVIFVLTKKKQPEPLIETRTGMAAPNTGEPIRIDLITGRTVPTGGDLIVSITCPEPFKAGVHIPWKLVLQATDGGLITIREGQFGYLLNNILEAPASGYGEIVIEHPNDDPNWDSQYDSILYLKSRNGQIYGKLSFGMHVGWDERGVPFGFHSFVNTNASRNLQGIPK